MQAIAVALALLIATMAIVGPALPLVSADSFSVTNRSQHPIKMTCTSKNDHLGTQVLSIGEERDWHFGGWPWTKFWCEFYKSDGKYLEQVTWSFLLDYFVSEISFDSHIFYMRRFTTFQHSCKRLQLTLNLLMVLKWSLVIMVPWQFH